VLGLRTETVQYGRTLYGIRNLDVIHSPALTPSQPPKTNAPNLVHPSLSMSSSGSPSNNPLPLISPCQCHARNYSQKRAIRRYSGATESNYTRIIASPATIICKAGLLRSSAARISDILCSAINRAHCHVSTSPALTIPNAPIPPTELR
jgi:hypothetical protein